MPPPPSKFDATADTRNSDPASQKTEIQRRALARGYADRCARALRRAHDISDSAREQRALRATDRTHCVGGALGYGCLLLVERYIRVHS